jgi:DNA-binding NtrC family response regulator
MAITETVAKRTVIRNNLSVCFGRSESCNGAEGSDMPIVLVIDDSRATRQMLAESFRDKEIVVETAGTATAGLELLSERQFDLVVLDVVLPDMTGLEVFQNIKRIDPRLPVIFITAGDSSDSAIEAMKHGAYDYLTKPLDLNRVRGLVAQALETRRRMRVPVSLPDSPADAGHSDQMLGRSPQITEVYKSIGRVASEDVTVLIRGESGTGKELIARAIYHHSARADAPFLAVNCAAIPDSLLESELFGHEKGSFTGADRQRIGKFEQCSGGTIFLDEVGDMSPLLQGKLLRLLQEQRFERVGGNETIETDVRIIAATHRDLEAMSQEGKFRTDLYYRLNGYTISVPPLRERGSDIELLIQRFLKTYARQIDREFQGIDPEALQLLLKYPWPGNVRELQSAIRRALLQMTGPLLRPEFLPDEIRLTGQVARPAQGGNSSVGILEQFVASRLNSGSTDLYSEALAAMESFLLTHVLQFTSGNQSYASRILGITRGSLRNKIHSRKIQIESTVRVDDEAEQSVPSNVS